MNTDGIQVMARLQTGLFKAAKFVLMKKEDIFTYKERNHEAVAIALDPLI